VSTDPDHKINTNECVIDTSDHHTIDPHKQHRLAFKLLTHTHRHTYIHRDSQTSTYTYHYSQQRSTTEHHSSVMPANRTSSTVNIINTQTHSTGLFLSPSQITYAVNTLVIMIAHVRRTTKWNKFVTQQSCLSWHRDWVIQLLTIQATNC